MFTDVVAMVGTGVSVASLGVGVYTLSRVRRVARAQSDERQLTQELLGVDQLELDLRRVISKLTEDDDRQAAALARDLSVKLGALQGVRRTLDPPARGQSGQVVRLEHGFFGQEFIIGELGRATSNIDIITGRTLLVNADYVMDHIRQACARGVEVRLVSLDPEAGDGVIADAAQSVSNPAPVDVSDYRRQLVSERRDTRGRGHVVASDRTPKWIQPPGCRRRSARFISEGGQRRQPWLLAVVS